MPADLEQGLAQPGFQPAGSRRPAWERFIGVAIALAALVIAGSVASGHWSEWQSLLARASLIPLVGALLLAMLGQFLNTVIAHEALKVSGTPIRLRSVYRIIAVGGMAKFIPGGVWQIGSQYGLGRAEGLGFRSSVLAWIEPTAFNVSVGGGIALLAATTVDYGVPIFALLVGAAASFTVSTNPVRHRIYKLVRLIPSDYEAPSPAAGWALSFAVTAAIIGLTGLGGMLVVEAFSLSPSPGFLGSVAAFVGSWAIGALVFPVPGGLGVREGALVIALSPWMPAHEALLVAAASRLVAVAAELLAAIVGLLIRPSGSVPAGPERPGASADG